MFQLLLTGSQLLWAPGPPLVRWRYCSRAERGLGRGRVQEEETEQRGGADTPMASHWPEAHRRVGVPGIQRVWVSQVGLSSAQVLGAGLTGT